MSKEIFKNKYPTEGIKYAGSKNKIIPYILELVNKTKVKSVFDGFAGTTRVSQALAYNGYDVVSNDHAIWSKVFGDCYLLGKSPENYLELIKHLNAVKPINGWFSEKYGGLKDDKKKPWQKHNTKKLDGIIQEIVNLKLNDIDQSVALTSLILALDKVDSTLGHYVAYLKEWSKRSFNDLTLNVPKIIISSGNHKIYNSDIFDLLPNINVDLAYYDPPYGSNNEKMPPSRIRYASYYHIWKTICLNDKPDIFGKANRRKDSSDLIAKSPFEDFRKNTNGKFVAIDAIKKLIKNTNAKSIILSYSSGGRATLEELISTIEENDELVELVKIDYKKNIMASMKWTNEWLRENEQQHYEFLFLIKKR